jgi:hypothetical protein
VARSRNNDGCRKQQRQDQEREFLPKIRLNHGLKITFPLTVLLPIGCYFLVPDCHHRQFKWQPRFRILTRRFRRRTALRLLGFAFAKIALP